MTPTPTRIDVDAGQMREAAKGFAANTNTVSAAYTKVSTAMQSISGMAGSDPAAQEWGEGFDEFLSQVLDGHYSAVGALANCAELTDATAVNHLNADGQSVVGAKPPPEALGISKDNLADVCRTPPPPSAGAAGEGKPWWWAKIEHLVGNIWPNGHQDRLHSAATALRAAASELRTAADQMQPHIASVEQQISPEIDSATVTLIKMQTGLRSIAASYDQLAQRSDDQAAHIDTAHSEMEAAAAELVAMLVLDILTDGLLSEMVAVVAARVLAIYERFRTLLRAAKVAMKGTKEGAGATKRALDSIKELLAKVKSFKQADNERLPPPRDRDLTKPTGDPATAHLPPLRQHYIKDVEDNLGSLERELRSQGASDEQIARALQAERRSIGQEYKDLTPEPMKSDIYGRNQERYGDPLGPTYDYLKNVKGLTDQQIIEGAKRTGGGDLGLGKK